MYSQLDNILSRYIQNVEISEESSCLTEIRKHFSKLISITEENYVLKFLYEQLELYFSSPYNLQYSCDTMVWAFMIYSQSSSTYMAIRETKHLTLPHPKYLQRLSSSFNISANSTEENEHFLKAKIKTLTEREKYVVLQLDEIYVKSRAEYKGGQILGYAENNSVVEARTIQAFLISSAFGYFKEVMSLHPVKNITGEDLLNITEKVVALVTKVGFKIIAIISDNNRVNRNMFDNLLQSNVIVQPDCKVFALYNTVHIFKNVRNNWLNLKDFDKTLVFPIDTGPRIRHSTHGHLA